MPSQLNSYNMEVKPYYEEYINKYLWNQERISAEWREGLACLTSKMRQITTYAVCTGELLS
jgi:hypothetical protein